MGIEQKALEMAMYRESRKAELQTFLSDSRFQAVMRKAVSFLTDGRGDNISLKISSGDASFTDGKSITVGMEDYFFSPEFTQQDWVTVYKALLAHEVQHINSSNFSDIKDIMKKYAKIMSGTTIPEQLVMKIGKTYLNILEDGRIENIIVHKLPGYKLPLLLMNQGTSVLSELEERAKTPGEEFRDFQNVCLCYTKTGRLPRGISVYAGTRFETEMKGVMPYIDLAVDARTSKDCKDICLKLLKKTAKYFADLLKEEIDQQMANDNSGGDPEKGQGSSGGGAEYTCSGEHEYNDSPNGSDAERKAKEKEAEGGSKKSGKPTPGGKKKTSGKDKTEQDGGSGKNNSSGDDAGGSGDEEDDQNGKGQAPGQDNQTGRNALRMHRDPRTRSGTTDWTDDFSGDGAEDYDTRELTPEEIQALRRGVADELEAAEEADRKELNKEEKERQKIEEKYGKEYIRHFVELFPVISNEALPPEMERLGRKLESDIERVIRVKRTEKRNMRVGQISGRDLYRVGMRDPHVFMRKGQPMKADMAVFLLLDNSGSMGSMGAQTTENGERIYLDKSTLSRTAAGIIERGLAKYAAMKISLFDVSGGQIRHATLKKFDEVAPKGSSRCYNSMKPVGIGGGNKDGYSIRVATSDLMSRREQKKVLVLLSDGLPSDYNGGTRAGMNDVRDAVREARQKGIIVIPIMFGRARDRLEMKDNFAEMYGQFISCDPIDIIGEFTKLFTKLAKNT